MFDIVEHRCHTGSMPGRIQSIERAVAVLRLLGAAPHDLALQEIAESLELPKGTTHGIVATLRHVGFVRQDRVSARYRLDSELQGLPGGGLDPHLLRSQSMNWADSLAANTGEAVLIGIPASDGVEVIHHVFCPDGSPQRFRLGEIRPVHASALGKVLPGGSAYTYLPASVRRFPPPDELAALLERCGFERVRYRTFAGGIVALHLGDAA